MMKMEHYRKALEHYMMVWMVNHKSQQVNCMMVWEHYRKVLREQSMSQGLGHCMKVWGHCMKVWRFFEAKPV